MDIKELLRGYGADLDSVQVAGNMAVVPLVSDQEFTSAVGDVDEVTLKRDIDYGKLSFENQSGRVGIVLQGATIITQQRAQDRTVPKATIMKGKATANVNAFCVQSHQPGHINPGSLQEEFKDDDVPFQILPPTLRANALQTASGGSHAYDRLWGHLRQYSGAFSGVVSSAELKDIYTRYKDQLNEFVAQFEPVPNQLGAIVLIDGQVVAIDVMPTYASWKKMWRTLIRDSYGAEAVRTSGAGKGVVFNYDLSLKNVTDLDSLEAEMERTVGALTAAIKQQWEQVHKQNVSTQTTNTITGVKLQNVESSGFFGQAVMHDEHCVYLSLVPKGSTPGSPGRFQRRSRIYGDDEFTF